MNELQPSPVRKALLATVLINAFVTPFLVSSVNLALPAIGAQLSIPASGLGWIISVYLVVLLAVLVPFGRLADLAGPGRIFFAGGLIYSTGSLFCGLAWDSGSLLFFRGLQAFGAGMQAATGNALLVASYPPQERGRVLGLSVSAVYLGLASGPFLGGAIVHLLSWRALFFINVPLGLLVTLLSISFINIAAIRGSPGKFDLWGTVFYCLTVACLGLGLPVVNTLRGALTTLAGAVLFAVFIRFESLRTQRVLEISLFRKNRTFSFSSVAALINYGATYSVGFLLSLYLQYVKGLTPAQAGIILIVQPAIMTVLAPLAGRISDRVEPRILSTLGMGLTAIGLAGLAFLDVSTPTVYIVGCLAVLGSGFGLFSAPNTNAIMGSVGREHLGSASALVGTMRLAGQLASMAILILVSSILLKGKSVVPAVFPEFLTSLRFSFGLFCGLCCLGIYFSSARGNLHQIGS